MGLMSNYYRPQQGRVPTQPNLQQGGYMQGAMGNAQRTNGSNLGNLLSGGLQMGSLAQGVGGLFGGGAAAGAGAGAGAGAAGGLFGAGGLGGMLGGLGGAAMAAAPWALGGLAIASLFNNRPRAQNSFDQWGTPQQNQQQQGAGNYQEYWNNSPDLQSHMANLQRNDPRGYNHMLQSFDNNGNGTVDPTEAAQWHYQTTGQREGRQLNPMAPGGAGGPTGQQTPQTYADFQMPNNIAQRIGYLLPGGQRQGQLPPSAMGRPIQQTGGLSPMEQGGGEMYRQPAFNDGGAPIGMLGGLGTGGMGQMQGGDSPIEQLGGMGQMQRSPMAPPPMQTTMPAMMPNMMGIGNQSSMMNNMMQTAQPRGAMQTSTSMMGNMNPHSSQVMPGFNLGGQDFMGMGSTMPPINGMIAPPQTSYPGPTIGNMTTNPSKTPFFNRMPSTPNEGPMVGMLDGW